MYIPEIGFSEADCAFIMWRRVQRSQRLTAKMEAAERAESEQTRRMEEAGGSELECGMYIRTCQVRGGSRRSTGHASQRVLRALALATHAPS